ncbi:hypothetical protein ACTFIY_000778 [Dictyostelium cf. discoideum]
MDILQYIGKGSHQDGRGLYTRGYHNLIGYSRYWGKPNAYPAEMADASVILFFRGFDGPIAGHAEWWFLSVFGCPINSFTEGGFRPNDHGYGQGQWNNFFGTAPPQNVYQYIINQVQSTDRFFRLVNYPLAPSILRRINDCEAELLQSTANANQVPNLQNQVTHLQNQVANLQITNQQLVNLNDFLAGALLNAMPQIPNLNAFLQIYGAGLEASNQITRNWYEARKNGGGGIGGIGGIDGIGGVDDGKKGDGKNGADGADDGWLKSGCVCPETSPCPVVIPCPEPVVCNIAKIQIQLNSTIKSLDECKKQKDQANGDLNVCQSHKDETQGWLTDCQKEYVQQTSHSSKDDTLTSLRNCQSEYRKETFKKDKLCRGLSKHVIGILDFCEEKVEKLRLANCE